MAYRRYPRTAGSDRRRQYENRGPEYRQQTEEEIEAAMDLLIQRAHQRLLERATAGRLTWQGDRIIHRSRWTRGSLTPPRQAARAVVTSGA